VCYKRLQGTAGGGVGASSSVDRLTDVCPSFGWCGTEASFKAVMDQLGPLRGDRCLEIGCGSGELLERVLAASAASAAGLDHSPDMLALAMGRNRQAIADERLLKLGDAAQIPWPDRMFTAALSANMFIFVEEPERVHAELFRILVPGGRLVIATMPGPLPKPSLRCPWLLPPMGPALRVYTDDEMRAMLERAGFTDIRVKSEGLQLAQGFRPAN
jgi:SAM-dependent methyltransferase